MLELATVKEIKGTVNLPSSPDLFFLTAVTAAVARIRTTVSPVGDTPLITAYQTMLEPAVSFETSGATRTITPVDPPDRKPLALALCDIPYGEFCVFALLGSGHVLSLTKVTQARLDAWTALLKRSHCACDITPDQGGTVIRMTSDKTVFVLPDSDLSEDDLHALLGLALGCGARATFELDSPFLSPLRHLLPAMGLGFTVKNNTPDRVTDPIAKRIRRMKTGRVSDTSQSFMLTADFSRRTVETDPVITLPGDDVLGGILMALKAIHQKGNLMLENVPLEAWCSQTLLHLRRAGCAPAVQKTGECSFGDTGLVQLQRFDLSGRKADCLPYFQFSTHLPAMLVIAAFSTGESVFRGLGRQRMDDPDGVSILNDCLALTGLKHGEMPDGLVLKGMRSIDGFDANQEFTAPLSGALAIMGLRCLGKTTIADTLLKQRWPDFETMIREISAN